jgi:hypothetical protein
MFRKSYGFEKYEKIKNWNKFGRTLFFFGRSKCLEQTIEKLDELKV